VSERGYQGGGACGSVRGVASEIALSTSTYYFNRCNPDESLAPDDERNLDFEQLGGQIRGESWINEMAFQIERSDKPPCLFFSGLRGSGKSTELRRLQARLEDPARAHLLTIIVDAEEMLDLSAKIDVSDVLAMVLYATERELLRRENKDPEKSMAAGIFRRFWDYVSRTNAEFTKAEMGLQNAWLSGKITMEMRTNASLRQKVQKLVAGHLSTFIQELYEEFKAFNERAKVLGYEGLAVIVDSLEKLQGTSVSWQEVLDSAERIFANDALFLRLPVPVVYTFPPALTRRLTSQVYYLPMLKLHDRKGQVHGPSFDAARTMIRKRIPDDLMEKIFGPAFETRLREIIDESGGYPRELVRFLRALLSKSSFPLSEQALQRLLRVESNPYARVVLATTANINMVARVWVKKSLTLEDPQEAPIVDELLNKNVILRYCNDEDWVDVHPAVARLAEVQAAARKFLQPPPQTPPQAPGPPIP
jgi:hypothetical protein